MSSSKLMRKKQVGDGEVVEKHKEAIDLKKDTKYTKNV